MSIDQIGQPSAAALTDRLGGALRATLFNSNLRINPRRLQTIAAAAAGSYLAYAAGELQAPDATAHGRALAADGLGHAGALALAETLMQGAWGEEAAPDSSHSALSYSVALLAGYMAAREEALLQEQERTRVALERVRAQQSA